MTDSSRETPRYPKKHLLAASGIAAVLSLSLLIFPSSEVEAKRTSSLAEFETSQQETPVASVDDATELAVTEKVIADTSAAAPFEQAQDTSKDGSAQSASPDSTAPASTLAALPGEPAAADEAEVAARPNEHRVTVEPGDNLASLFERVSLPPATLHRVLGSSPEARRLGNIRPGQVFDFILDQDGGLLSLSSSPSALETLTASREGDGYRFQRELITPQIREAHASGRISSSLFNAATEAGLPYALTLDLANVFGYDIDFALDLRDGDSFEVIYEEKLVDGKRVGSGNILAARFVNAGKPHTAVRHTDRNGNSSYYTAEGNSMRKAFIRTPVDIARISSRFSSGRLHPILNKIRAHKGVDYSAPIGTAIKATGDGKVFLAGRQGGYGNVVIIQHGNKYRTLYGHMKGFAAGIRTGSPVRQGQVIGYIGTTGLSTGPHLHYEFQAGGVHVDPLSQKLPMAEPIARADLPKFLEQSKLLMARLDQQGSTRLASNASDSNHSSN